MLFDKMMGIIEKHLPEYRKLGEQAHLFHFNGIPHEFLPKQDDLSKEEWDDRTDNFMLPFSVTCVEDQASAVLLTPVERNITGIYQTWLSIEIIDMKVDAGKFANRTPVKEEVALRDVIKDDAFTLTVGTVNIRKGTNGRGYSLAVVPLKYLAGNKDQVMDEDYMRKHGLPVKVLQEALSMDIGRNLTTSLEELMLLNNKERFVVERLSRKPKLHGKQLPRAHQRSTYTLLTINEVHKLFDEDREYARQRSELVEPHYRRRHYRYLKNEKYKRDEKGDVKRLVIDPIWIGSKEAKVKGHKYVVRLDL